MTTMQACSVLALALLAPVPAHAALDWVQVAPDHRHFALAGSGARFVPWGLNYACTHQLIEDYWETDWPRVERDFREMKALGANVIRVHLQTGKFLDGPGTPNPKALAALARLLKLAEETGLHLDLTGLACYRAEDIPKWYDALDEAGRWQAQAVFWEAIAKTCAGSPAVFCYDLMNEPVVPGERRQPGQWMSGQPLGGYDFVQFIALDPAGRPREEIARQWIRTLTAAIRKQDRRHLVTVGLLPADDAGRYISGFVPAQVAPEVDYVSVHIYPNTGKVDAALKMLKGFSQDKPVVVEETFILSCGEPDLERFLRDSRDTAAGWMGHYSGESIAELRALRDEKKGTIGQAIFLQFLELFQRMTGEMTGAN